ncbi:MAG: GGDEF domain-containing phosphodiesterase, partial [Lachnospiraceae bacterium]|nr:GGDEF domain-containing phosphodiesterase [Lachnospiraceae bacterium]
MISCVDIKQRFDEAQFANLLINLLDRSYEVDDDLIHVTTSIGSASYPDDTTNIERLMSCAEFARGSAKHSSNTCTYSAYSEDDMPKLQRKFMIEKKLQEVDYDRDFRMCYQPQISVETGELVGLEALIRWTDSDIGTVEPEELIPIAEEMGIMSNLGEWVLTESLFQISKWNENYGKDLSIGVNISASQLEEENFAEQVMDMIANTGVKSEWVDFEVNEAVAIEYGRRIRNSINRLRKENVTFSVDDFGSGYTSFSRMIDFHFDCIKISEELIHRLASSSDAQVVVKSIIDMAHGMNLKVTAEGVEQQEVMNIIRPMGCDVVQGFLFGGALPADEFEATWLQK